MNIQKLFIKDLQSFSKNDLLLLATYLGIPIQQYSINELYNQIAAKQYKKARMLAGCNNEYDFIGQSIEEANELGKVITYKDPGSNVGYCFTLEDIYGLVRSDPNLTGPIINPYTNVPFTDDFIDFLRTNVLSSEKYTNVVREMEQEHIEATGQIPLDIQVLNRIMTLYPYLDKESILQGKSNPSILNIMRRAAIGYTPLSANATYDAIIAALNTLTDEQLMFWGISVTGELLQPEDYVPTSINYEFGENSPISPAQVPGMFSGATPITTQQLYGLNYVPPEPGTGIFENVPLSAFPERSPIASISEDLKDLQSFKTLLAFRLKDLQSFKTLRPSLEDLKQIYILNLNSIKGEPVKYQMPLPFIIPDLTTRCGEIIKEIASGTFGTVYATDKCAIKNIKSQNIDTSVVRENAILRYLNHPNIIELLGLQFEPTLQIGMQLANGTWYDIPDLDKESVRKPVYYQLFRAVAYCHSKYIWHLDIKPENILIFKNNADFPIIKLADFGLSGIYMQPSSTNWVHVVTLPWRAPELILEYPLYTSKVDIWSIGIMLLDDIMNKETTLGSDEITLMTNIFRIIGSPPVSKGWKNPKRLPKWHEYKPFSKVKRMTMIIPDDGENKTLTASEMDLIKRINNEWLDSIDEDISTSQNTAKEINEYIKSSDITEDEINELKSIVDKIMYKHTSKEEYELLLKLLAWPNNRIKALEALNSDYFNSVRNKIELALPAEPIITLECADLLYTEQSSINYALAYSGDLNIQMRTILFNWLYNVSKRLALIPESIFHSFVLIDTFLEKVRIEQRNLQMYGCVALYLASCMYNDIGDPFIITRYSNLSGGAFTTSDMETGIKFFLTILDFQLIIPNAFEFLKRFINLRRTKHLILIKKLLYKIILNKPEYLPSKQAEIVVLYMQKYHDQVIDCNINPNILTDELIKILE
jgi:serine/threonine protein kinase